MQHTPSTTLRNAGPHAASGISHRSRPLLRAFAAAIALSLAAAACGGNGAPTGGEGDDGDPQWGGTLTYMVEAETAEGYCLPEARLAISGSLVARAVYDSLMTLDANGEPRPWLAESVEANDDFTEWTIQLRDGVTFHDGSPLDAQIVADNLNTTRGEFEGREADVLALLIFENVEEIEPVEDLAVRVTLREPWVSFSSYLASALIMARAQLEDEDDCHRNLIGTGPFTFESWVVNDHLTVERNDDWWFAEVSGVDYPYLDEVTFVPAPEVEGNVGDVIVTGEVDARIASGPAAVGLMALADRDEIGIEVSEDFTEVDYLLLNHERPPFDDVTARRALAYAFDRDEYNQIFFDGECTPASGPFSPGNMGYLEDTGFPEYDPDEARRLVAEYEAETGEPLRFSITSTAVPGNVQRMQWFQQGFNEVGMDVSLRQIADQSELISNTVAGEFQAQNWRHHPGGDPDRQYIWWHEGILTNFARLADPVVDDLLDRGRTETDPNARVEIYEELNRHMADQVHGLWRCWTIWAVGLGLDVHGVFGPGPPDGAGPFPGLAEGHGVWHVWKST